ncbi:MAG: DEAD/DEAH box helicase family protein [Saprospiraceae bacterium]|nr:DEAD/DEAH box helicase family protein [Saprospiraceae bacterium]
MASSQGQDYHTYPKGKGDVFELFTKYFLQSHPEYTSTLKHVWLFSELTPKQKQELKVPSNDQGIDLVAETKTGEFWAIQCKYLENENQRLSHHYISTFGNLAFAISGKFAFGLVCTTAERFSKAYSGQDSISFCTIEVWRNLTEEQFQNIRNLAYQRPVVLKPYEPFPHQERAIHNAFKHFSEDKESRGKLIFPCGSGKSLAGFWIAEKLKAKNIIVAVPSLSLVKQTLVTWLRESVALNLDVDWICVCSDESIGKQDDISVLVQDLGIPCITNEDFIAEWLRRKSKSIKVIFTTYQSGVVISAASKRADFSFDLGILDEAHKTVGQKGKLFSHLLYDQNILIKKRLFMTATERRYLGSSDEIASMDNVDLYGDTFELLTFKEALEVKPPILSDYRIITVVVEQGEVKDLIERNAYIKADPR